MTKPVITTRAGKGSALTWTEGDTNLTNLRDATITLTAGSGGTDVVSDLNGAVTLIAGTNVTLSGDNTAKTITINSTASGGATTLDDLTDVVITAAATNDALIFNGTNWVDTALSGVTVGTATNANYINIATPDGNTSDTTMSVVLVGSASTGNQQPHIDSGLTYNASTNALTATSFSGALNGSVGATTPSTGAFTTITASNTITAGSTTANTAKLQISGSLSSTAWTTAGIGLRASGFVATDTNSTGTIAASHIHAMSTASLASTNTITVTDAATLYLAGGPTASTNTTITNKWGLLIGADGLKIAGGALNAGGSNGTSGQVLTSTGTGIQWATSSGAKPYQIITLDGVSTTAPTGFASYRIVYAIQQYDTGTGMTGPAGTATGWTMPAGTWQIEASGNSILHTLHFVASDGTFPNGNNGFSNSMGVTVTHSTAGQVALHANKNMNASTFVLASSKTVYFALSGSSTGSTCHGWVKITKVA